MLPYQLNYGYVYRDSADTYFFLNKDNVAGNIDRRYDAFSYSFSGDGDGFSELANRYTDRNERRIGFFVEVCSAVVQDSTNRFGPDVMEIDRIRVISEYDMTDMIALYYDDLGLPEAIRRYEMQRSGSN